MSGDPRQRAGWLSRSYDKLLLVIMLLVLLGSSLILIWQISRMQNLLNQAQWDHPPSAPHRALPVDVKTYREILGSLTQPFQLDPKAHRLMTGEVRVYCVRCQKPIGYNAAQCPFCGAQQPAIIDPKKLDTDADGIPDWWETKYNLNPMDRTDALADPDGDGFSNLEEYVAGTDPTGARDFPAPAVKLRVRRVVSEPFFLRFQGVNEISEGVFQYQLNLRSLERTYFVKIGEEVQGFKVVEYLPKAAPGPTVRLQQGEKSINLIKGMAVQQEELTAQLVFLLDRTPIRARVGDVIQLKGQDYKVVDIGRNAVVIRDLKTDKDIQVPQLSPADLAPAGGAASSPGSGAVGVGSFP